MFGTPTVHLTGVTTRRKVTCEELPLQSIVRIRGHALREQAGECSQGRHPLCIPGRIRQRETDPQSRKVQISHTVLHSVRKQVRTKDSRPRPYGSELSENSAS